MICVLFFSQKQLADWVVSLSFFFHWNNQHYCQNTECGPYLYQVFNMTCNSVVWMNSFLGLEPSKTLVWSLYAFLMLEALLLKTWQENSVVAICKFSYIVPFPDFKHWPYWVQIGSIPFLSDLCYPSVTCSFTLFSIF